MKRKLLSILLRLGGFTTADDRADQAGEELPDLATVVADIGKRLDAVEKMAMRTERKVYRDEPKDEDLAQMGTTAPTRLPNPYLDGG